MENLEKLKELTHKLNEKDEELRDSLLRFNRLVDLIPEGILVIKDYKIDYANNYAVKLFGFESQDEIIDKNIFSFVRYDSEESLGKLIKNSTDIVSAEDFTRSQFVKKDGQILVGAVAVTDINWGGETGKQIIIRDITNFVDLQSENILMKYKLGIVNQITIDLNEPFKLCDGWVATKIYKGEDSDKYMCVAEKDKILKRHTHIQKEIMEVVEGEVDVHLSENIVNLKAGDKLSIEPMTSHSCVPRKFSVIMNTFTPPLS